MGILEVVVYGFFTAFGWWGANHYVIEPYFPPPIERKEAPKNGTAKEKTWIDHYERIFDNVLRILWLILLIRWINSEHTIFK
jgi:hypothetical protein